MGGSVGESIMSFPRPFLLLPSIQHTDEQEGRERLPEAAVVVRGGVPWMAMMVPAMERLLDFCSPATWSPQQAPTAVRQCVLLGSTSVALVLLRRHYRLFGNDAGRANGWGARTLRSWSAPVFRSCSQPRRAKNTALTLASRTGQQAMKEITPI